MKKTLAAVVLILLLIPAELIRVILANGTIHKTSDSQRGRALVGCGGVRGSGTAGNVYANLSVQ